MPRRRLHPLRRDEPTGRAPLAPAVRTRLAGVIDRAGVWSTGVAGRLRRLGTRLVARLRSATSLTLTALLVLAGLATTPRRGTTSGRTATAARPGGSFRARRSWTQALGTAAVRLVSPLATAVGWWTHVWASAARSAAAAVGRALGRWGDAWAGAAHAAGGAAWRGTGWWTHRWAGAAAAVRPAAQGSLGSWTEAWSRATPAAGRGLLRGSAWTQRQAAAGARLATARFVPAMVSFAALAAAVITWVVLMTSATIPALANYDQMAQWAFDIPQDTTLPNLAERSVIYAADGSKLAVLHDEQDRRLVPLDTLPDHVWQAVIAAEDRRFFEHEGYDIQAIGRAAVANLRARDIVQGGSTITQQLAKQNFLSDAQTFQRKAAELTYAIALEERLSKRQLLERYLNQVYFGAGAYGIAAGAEEWFGVSPEELTAEQAALLGGLIRGPSRLSPREHPQRATERRDTVLRAMEQEGYLTDTQLQRALQSPLRVVPHRERKVTEPYVVEEVKRAFFANPAFGDTRSERIDRLFEGGLKVHTTIRPALQDAAHQAVRNAYPPDGTERTGAIAAVDPRSGQTLAFHSGTNFEAEQFDLATQGRRQPGSAFKLFVLATALEEGRSIHDTVDGSAPREFDWNEHQPPWKVRNFGGADFGQVSLREALVNSVNTAFAELVLDVGITDTVETARRFGIDVAAAFGPPSARGPAIAIGGLHNGVTTREMASAVGTLAAGGERVEPYVIERVVDGDGDEVYQHDAERQQVVSTQTAGTMIHTMQQVVQRGTGVNAQIPGRWVAGKTGTSQRFADAWFVGTTPRLAAAAWVGNPSGRVPYPGMTGGSAVAPMWREFMTLALRGTEPQPFALPPPPPEPEAPPAQQQAPPAQPVTAGE